MLVAGLVLSINFAPVPGKGTLVAGLALIALAARSPSSGSNAVRPTRSTTWGRGETGLLGRRVAGIIVFGSLMGAMFISQQYLQNVLGYDTVEAGAAFLPAIVFMVLVAPRSAKLVESRGARTTLLSGYVFLFLGFLSMLLLWEEDSSYWQIGIAYAFMGIGVGLAGTPASHSLTGSVPVHRAGMASGTADLQRDLGGAIMQSVFGALLTAGYASAFSSAIASSSRQQGLPRRGVRADQVVRRRRADRAAAPELRRPDHRRGEVVLPAGRRLGLHRRRGRGPDRRRTRLLFFPRKDAEQQLLRHYPAEDAPAVHPPEPAPEEAGAGAPQPADIRPLARTGSRLCKRDPDQGDDPVPASDKRDQGAVPYATGWVARHRPLATHAMGVALFLPEGRPRQRGPHAGWSRSSSGPAVPPGRGHPRPATLRGRRADPGWMSRSDSLDHSPAFGLGRGKRAQVVAAGGAAGWSRHRVTGARRRCHPRSPSPRSWPRRGRRPRAPHPALPHSDCRRDSVRLAALANRPVQRPSVARRPPPHPSRRLRALSLHASPARLSAAISSLFAVGSACFVLGSVPAYVDVVGGTPDAVTFFVGSLFFTTASFAQLVQAQSPAMTGVDRVQQHVRRPVRLWAWLPHDRGWCAAATQFPGTLFFNVSTFAALAHNATVGRRTSTCGGPTCSAPRSSWSPASSAILALGGRLFTSHPRPWTGGSHG